MYGVHKTEYWKPNPLNQNRQILMLIISQWDKIYGNAKISHRFLLMSRNFTHNLKFDIHGRKIENTFLIFVLLQNSNISLYTKNNPWPFVSRHSDKQANQVRILNQLITHSIDQSHDFIFCAENDTLYSCNTEMACEIMKFCN